MLPFSVTLTPRFYETDALGHINNTSISAWFEVARIRFMESLGADTARSWILASLQLDFLAETFYGAEVELRMVAAVPGNTSMSLHCEMWQREKLCVRAKAVMVHLDVENKTSTPLPASVRQQLENLAAGEKA